MKTHNKISWRQLKLHINPIVIKVQVLLDNGPYLILGTLLLQKAKLLNGDENELGEVGYSQDG